MANIPNNDNPGQIYFTGLVILGASTVTPNVAGGGSIGTVNYGFMDYLINLGVATGGTVLITPVAERVVASSALVEVPAYAREVAPPHELVPETLIYQLDASAPGSFWLRGVPCVGVGQRLAVPKVGASPVTVSVWFMRKAIGGVGAVPYIVA